MQAIENRSVSQTTQVTEAPAGDKPSKNGTEQDSNKIVDEMMKEEQKQPIFKIGEDGATSIKQGGSSWAQISPPSNPDAMPILF